MDSSVLRDSLLREKSDTCVVGLGLSRLRLKWEIVTNPVVVVVVYSQSLTPLDISGKKKCHDSVHNVQE